MVYLKPLFALFTLAISAAPLLMVSAAKFEVSISTDNDDDKQFQRVYACTIASTNCAKTRHYRNLWIDSKPLSLELCYHPSTFDNFVTRYLTEYNRYYVNTFYLACLKDGPDCVKNTRAEYSPEKAQELIESSIQQQTECFVKVYCYDLDEVDDKCIRKIGSVQ